MAALALVPLTGCQSMTSSQSERWTILCQEFNGGEHQQHCAAYADALSRTPDIDPAAVRCDPDNAAAVSRLYYGAYDCARVQKFRSQRMDPSPEMQRDYQLILDLADEQQQRVFPLARMVPLVAPQPQGPPDHALVGAPGACSLQIAVFYPEAGFDDPRGAAVDLARELRDEGHEAYYHHGPSQSMVTVGSFEPSAELSSPEVQAVIRSDPRFRYNYENYEVRKRIIQGESTGTGSFLVKIPKPADRP